MVLPLLNSVAVLLTVVSFVVEVVLSLMTKVVVAALVAALVAGAATKMVASSWGSHTALQLDRDRDRAPLRMGEGDNRPPWTGPHHQI